MLFLHRRGIGLISQLPCENFFSSSSDEAHCRRFGWGLGMQYVAKSDLSTGNTTFASHVLKSNDLVSWHKPGLQRLQQPMQCTL